MKVFEFVNYDVFHGCWLRDYQRPCDPLLVFYHYVLCQHEYRTLSPKQPETDRSELLPDGWNEAQEADKYLYYVRSQTGEKIRLEYGYDASERKLRIVFRRLVDLSYSVVILFVDDYLNEDFRNRRYKNVFKPEKQFKLFSQLIHALQALGAVERPADWRDGGQTDQRRAAQKELDAYAYEGSPKKETSRSDEASTAALKDDMDKFEARVDGLLSRQLKRRRRQILGIRRRRSSGASLSSRGSAVQATERDPLNEVAPTTTTTTTVPVVIKDEAMQVDEPNPPSAAPPPTPSQPLQPTNRNPSPRTPCSLASWCKASPRVPASADTLNTSRTAGKENKPPSKPAASHPITDFFTRRRSEPEKPPEPGVADPKLTVECRVVLRNVFPIVTGRL